MIEIAKPCPVCGKDPKTKFKSCGFGATCRLQCKPFLQKPHLKAEYSGANMFSALRNAILDWNKEVENWGKMNRSN